MVTVLVADDAMFMRNLIFYKRLSLKGNNMDIAMPHKDGVTVKKVINNFEPEI